MFKEINNIKIFLEEPNREFHLREIARIMKKSPATVKKMLSEFVKEKVILREKKKGFEIYKANIEDKKYKETKKVYNRNMFERSGIIDFLIEKFNLPVIILFGSCAKGEDNQNSDIDLFILTESKKEADLNKYEKLLKRKIQLHIFNKKEFNNLKMKNKGLFNSILNGIILNGYLEVE